MIAGMNVRTRPATIADLDFARRAHHAAYRDVVTRQWGQWEEELQDRFFGKDWGDARFDVIMVDGPRFEGEDTTFSFVGVVQNIGEGKALWVRVYIDVYNPGDVLLAQSYHLVDKRDLEFGEQSTWRVTFEDEDYLIRDLADLSKTVYDITWTEED